MSHHYVQWKMFITTSSPIIVCPHFCESYPSCNANIWPTHLLTYPWKYFFMRNWPSPLELYQSLPIQPCMLCSDKGSHKPTHQTIFIPNFSVILSISHIILYSLCLGWGLLIGSNMVGILLLNSTQLLQEINLEDGAPWIQLFHYRCLGSRKGNNYFFLRARI